MFAAQDFEFKPVQRQVILEVTKPGSLGLTFPTGRVPLVIVDIVAGSLAAQQSRLSPGMRLVAVNSTSVEGLSYEQAIDLIKLSKQKVEEDGRTLRMTFVPPRPAAIRTGETDSDSSDAEGSASRESDEIDDTADRKIAMLFSICRAALVTNPKIITLAGTGMSVCIGLSGWLAGEEDTVESHWQFLRDLAPPTALHTAESYALAWELDELEELGSAFYDFLKERAALIAADVGATAMVGSVIATLALPVALVGATHLVANPWIIVHHRAKKAGQILAKLLLAREHGHRPVTLLGFSTGARLLFSCLEALADAGPDAVGLVESAFIVGGAMNASPARWARCRSVVSHRLVNGTLCTPTHPPCHAVLLTQRRWAGFKEDDLVLALLFRANSLKVGSVAGLQPVEVAGVENLDLSSICPGKTGHGNYREMAADIFAAMGIGGNSCDVFVLDASLEPEPEPEPEPEQRRLSSEV